MKTDLPDWVIGHHTLPGNFRLSNGRRSKTYIDLRSAMLCIPCQYAIYDWIEEALSRLPRRYARSAVNVIGIGMFGALVTPVLQGFGGAHALIWNPKEHGTVWSGQRSRSRFAVLVNDVKTTGATLAAARKAAEREGFEVVREFVAVDRSDEA